MKVVVFFPSWRFFGHFAYPLFAPLADRYELVFLHTEQAVYGWNDAPDLRDEGIEIIDLKTLDTYSFVVALRRLNPDRVVVFDKGWMQDRAFLHAAGYLKIRSFHIQHGLISALDQKKTRRRVARALREGWKIIKTFWLYNRTLLEIGRRAWVCSLRYQLALIINPTKYYYDHRNEVQADRAGLIGERDRRFFIEQEGYREEQLVPFGSLMFEAAYRMTPRAPQAQLLLITQPLFEDHLLAGGGRAKEEHIRAIIEASSLPVAIKPHPREDRDWYQRHFSEASLRLYPPQTDINTAIADSSHVIGYFSTALINALILQRPVAIIRWIDDDAYVLALDKAGQAASLWQPDQIDAFTSTSEAASLTENPYCYSCATREVLIEELERL